MFLQCRKSHWRFLESTVLRSIRLSSFLIWYDVFVITTRPTSVLWRCKTPVTPEKRPYSVPTAFYKCRSPRSALCSRQQRSVRAVQSLRTACGAVCFDMLKTNAAGWRLHSVLDNISRLAQCQQLRCQLI